MNESGWEPIPYSEDYLTAMVKHATLGIVLATLLLFQVVVADELGVITEGMKETVEVAAVCVVIYSALPIIQIITVAIGGRLIEACRAYRGGSA